MVGKNNQHMLHQKHADKNYTYGIRKLSIGVASVAVSTFIGFSGAQPVLATTEIANAPAETLLSASLSEEVQDDVTTDDGVADDAKLADDVEESITDGEVPTEDTSNDPSETVDDSESEADTEVNETTDTQSTSKVRASSGPQNAEEAIDDFNKQEQDKGPSEKQESLGAISGVQQIDEGLFEVDYETGQQGRLYFYDDNIIRYYVDPEGKFEDPKPRDPERPADIVIADFDAIDKVKVSLKDTKEQATLATDAMAVQLDKKKGTLKLLNSAGEVVVEELEALKISKTDTTQTLKSHADSQYFGGGMQNGRFTHKGHTINIKNENSWNDGGVSSPAPFYWSTDGYGVVRNTFQEGTYDFEDTDPEAIKTNHKEGRFDAFYIIADKPADILDGYYEITGTPVVYPEFAHYEGHLNGLQRDYWIPLPEGEQPKDTDFYSEKTGKYYRELNPRTAIENAAKNLLPDNYEELSDEEKAEAEEKATSQATEEFEAFISEFGGILEKLNGEPGDDDYEFTARALIERYGDYDMPLGWILVNDGYAAGYGQEDTLAGNIQNLKEFQEWAEKMGVETGLWTQSDLTPDESLPAVLQRDLAAEVGEAGVRVLKTDVAWVGSGYNFGLNGTEISKQIMEEFSQGARPFIITVDGWGGTQRNAGVWTGDQAGGNWEFIRFHIPTYIGTGLSGQPNIGSDVDGIHGGSNPIVNTRDYQWKTFTLFQMNMDGWGTSPKNPFNFDATTTDINRSYLKLKSALLPYAYSIHHDATEGLPPVRAMFLDFPDEKINYTDDVKYQFMYGDSFLVAPIYQNTASDEKGNDIRNGIVLPAGENWIDLFTGEVYEGGQVLNNFAAPLWKLPVFVRQGAIVPVNEPNNSVQEIDRTKRIVEFYPAGDTSFTLTEDDGRTTAYRDGAVAKTEITSHADDAGNVTLTIGKTTGEYEGYIKDKQAQFNVNLTAKPDSVKLFIGDREVQLSVVDNLEDFNKGENVVFYDEKPNLNQFSSEDGDYYGKELIKNPVLRVKSEAFDTTSNDVRLELTGYTYDNDKFEAYGEETGEAPAITDNVATPTTLQVAWNAVEDADHYELEADGVRYTQLTTTDFTHENLSYDSEHTYRVRAVRADNTTTPWSQLVTLRTAEDPRVNIIQNVKVSADKAEQPGEEIANLADGDTNTRYHSQYGVQATPETITFEFGDVESLDKFDYVPRPDGGNGTITELTVEYSEDGENWQSIGDAITWAGDNKVKSVDLAGINAKFVRFNVTGAVGDFVSGQEVSFYRVPQPRDKAPYEGHAFTDGEVSELAHLATKSQLAYLDSLKAQEDDEDNPSEGGDDDNTHIDQGSQSTIDQPTDTGNGTESGDTTTDDTLPGAGVLPGTDAETSYPTDTHTQATAGTLGHATVKADTLASTAQTEATTQPEAADAQTARLPQTGLATAGLGIGLLMSGIGSAFAFKKRD